MFQPTRVSMYASSALQSPLHSQTMLPPSTSSSSSPHIGSPQHKPLTPQSTSSSTSNLILPSINNNNNQSYSTIGSEPTTPKFLRINIIILLFNL